MQYLFSLEYSEDMTHQKVISKKQIQDTILSLLLLSSNTQTSFESKKIDMAKDLIFDSSVFLRFFVHQMSKECQHTLNSTRMWVAFGLCLNNSPTAMISL